MICVTCCSSISAAEKHRLTMCSLRSFQCSAWLVFALPFNCIHFAVASNSYISDYKCGHRDHSLTITFVCSADAENDISDEIQSLLLFGRCGDYRSVFDVLSVNFSDCALPVLPDQLLQMTKLVELDLSAISLESVTIEDFRNISWSRENDYGERTLNLSWNQLTQFDQPIFSEDMWVRQLDLSNNRLEILGADAFFGLSHLRHLFLQRNSIRKLSNSTFARLAKLITLDLSENALQLVHVEGFQNLSKLEELSLQRTNASELPPGVFRGLHRLETLNLSHANRRTSNVGELFDEWNRLKHLDLAFNRIDLVRTGDFVHLQHLELLNLSNCRVRGLESGSMSPLRKLNVLDLSSNRLRRIDFGLFLPSFRNLWALHLNGNQLTELSDRFDKLFPRLATLMVTNNQFNCSYVKAFLQTMDRLYYAVSVNEDLRVPNVGGITCQMDDAEISMEIGGNTMELHEKAGQYEVKTGKAIFRSDSILLLMILAIVVVMVLILIAELALIGVVLYRKQRM